MNSTHAKEAGRQGGVWGRLVIILGIAVLLTVALTYITDNKLAARLLSFGENRVSHEEVEAQSIAFRSFLVSHSPWEVEWRVLEGEENGVHKMSFSLPDNPSALSGRIFDARSGVAAGEVTDIRIMRNCITFVFSVTGTTYNYCLRTSASPELEGVISRLGSYTAVATARPVKR